MYVIILYKIIIFSYVNFYECILIKPVQRTGNISSKKGIHNTIND